MKNRMEIMNLELQLEEAIKKIADLEAQLAEVEGGKNAIKLGTTLYEDLLEFHAEALECESGYKDEIVKLEVIVSGARPYIPPSLTATQGAIVMKEYILEEIQTALKDQDNETD